MGSRSKRPWIIDVSTDSGGRYTIPNVLPGKYELRCGLTIRNITVKPGKSLTCNFPWPGDHKTEPHKSKGGRAI